MKTANTVALIATGFAAGFISAVVFFAAPAQGHHNWYTNYDVRDQPLELQPWVTGRQLLDALDSPYPIRPETRPDIWQLPPLEPGSFFPDDDGSWWGEP